MMIHSFILKNMMRSYDRQIGNGRRIKSIKKYLTPLIETEDSMSISKDARRTRLVKQISHEIVDNLLGSGSTNPIIQEIKEQISEEFPFELLFNYSVKDTRLQIIERRPEGNVKLSNGDREKVLARIKKITQEKVNETMV